MDNDRGYPMNDMPDPKDAADFLAVFSTFWPLALVGALAGLARGFRRFAGRSHGKNGFSLLL